MDYRKILYKNYNYLFEENLQYRHPELLDLHDEVHKLLNSLDKEAKIVDLGCGFGDLIYTLMHKGFKNVLGVEIGELQINYMKQKGIPFVKKDIISFLKEVNDSFDLIFMFDVLEHFYKSEVIEILSLAKRSLNQTGHIVLRVPNAEAIFKGSIMYGDFTHETFFTKRSLIQLAGALGFSSIQVYPVYVNPKSIKSLIAVKLYKLLSKIYSLALKIDNPESFRTFLPTQNIIAIITK